MSRDLFGDVSRPPASIGNRKWYTVPVSLIAHVAILVPLVLVPLLAADVLPMPHATDVFVVGPPPPPEPPAPPPPRRPDTPPPAVDQNAAPVKAPDGFGPETGLEPEPWREDDRGIPHGVVPGGNGVVTDAPPPPPPPPAPEPQVPVRLTSQMRAPVKVRDAMPVYPVVAQAARIEGTVIIEAIIGLDGSVQDARILRSRPMLDQAALDAVRQWRYTPASFNGRTIPVIITVTVTFTLSK
jgi:protein TonB